MKEQIREFIDQIGPELEAMSDRIYDLAEISSQEFQSCQLLEDFLEKNGFQVEHGAGGMETAFRAVYEQGEGGPSFGLLAEYDALPMGHGCGHQMQGPSILGAALCIRKLAGDAPYKIVVYGTPAEESLGGKIIMQENGCFQDIDIALMMHAAPDTCVDIKTMALENFRVTFYGKEAHAAMNPEQGRSALDAILLSFHGIELLREHVLEDTRMHYTVLDAGGPANVVPGKAVAEYTLRSYNTSYLAQVVERFKKIIEGASLMTETAFTMERDPAYSAKIPCMKLNELMMENARAFGAPQLAPPREKTGSTDFGNVMYAMPGSCIRLAFVPPGTPAHSQGYLDAGKSEAAHRAVRLAAEILAGTCLDILKTPGLMQEIQEDFAARKEQMGKGI
ncbi:MAG TPA: M20 family metallopeptidase [Candidatus Eisenbergiella merdavium]|uniref:Peptidase M20 domain-containing protein 2 n=1 Tax=Candidatus Eisenbergiella merdavium TaxID=2838551 RepID=A0A9D2NFC1_9FIRM|nr:M20 family metallopeptidase [Candidatus Eisenbergiella merdavium]